jgi:hypothetical protein
MYHENLPFMFLTGHSCLFDRIYPVIRNALNLNVFLFDWNPESQKRYSYCSNNLK